MKTFIVTLIASAGIFSALAETAPAGASMAQEIKYPWESSLSAGLTLTSGNSESLLGTIKFLTGKKTPANEFSFDADASYGKSDGKANLSTIHGFGQWNHLFSERLYSYVRLEGLHDDIAEVRYRATLTAGAGYYFVKTEKTYLAGEVGPGVVTERVGSHDDTYATLRLAERFEHKFAPGTRVWQTAELLPQVDKFQNYIFNLEAGAEAALSKSLSLQVVLTDNYRSEPAVGRKRNDVKLVSGVVYKF